MFEKVNFNEDIENHILRKEHEYLLNKYVKHSENIENKRNTYLKKFYLINQKTGISVLKKDVVKEFNENKNLIYTKTKELERIAKEENLTPIFLTITNPSAFHPFLYNTKKNKFIKVNKKFNFLNLENRIDESYKNVNSIFRELYKNIKLRENKNMKFIKVIEPHKSLVCHLHRILYINIDTFEKVEKQFNNIKSKYNLKKCKLEKLKDAKGSSYIIKYLLKNFKSEEIKRFDGYKKYHKIRIFTMSNLPMRTDIFKKLYYNNREINETLLKDIKENNSEYKNLYEYYTKNTTIKLKINKDDNVEYKTINFDENNRFTVYKEVKKVIKEKKQKELKLIDAKEKDFNFLKEKYFYNKDKENEYFYKIETKKLDFATNEYIYYILEYQRITTITEEERTAVIDFKIYDKIKKELIYNKQDFEVKYIDYEELKAS